MESFPEAETLGTFFSAKLLKIGEKIISDIRTITFVEQNN